MIYELQPHDNLRPLLHGMTHHLILDSVFTGRTHAKIYGNDPTQPSAVLFHYKHRLYLMGQPHSTFAGDIQALFQTMIFPQTSAEGYQACVISYDSENWLPHVEKIAAGRRSHNGLRRYFRRNAAQQPFSQPENFAIRPIDAALIAQTHLENFDLLFEEIHSERSSVDEFLKHSFGVCALVSDTIAGLCTSEYNAGARCEVGIMTMEAYQRRGIATALAQALASEAASRGVSEIGWHCWAGNAGSVATALKAGFTPALEYRVQEIWYA